MFAYKRKSSSKSNSSSKTKTLPGDEKVTYHKVRSGDSLFAMSLKLLDLYYRLAIMNIDYYNL